MRGLTAIANSLYDWLRKRRPGRSGSLEFFSHPTLGDFHDEFDRIFRSHCYPQGVVDPHRVDELERACWYLSEIAHGDVDEFVALKGPWKQFHETPVYLITLGNFMLAFAVAEDDLMEEPVVVALKCGLWDRDQILFWENFVLPRLKAILA
jgi:hypothetical protein